MSAAIHFLKEDDNMQDEDELIYDDNEVVDEADDEIDMEQDEEETSQEFHPLKDMIDAIGSEDYSAASDIFQSELNSKLRDAIETRKIALSDTIFNKSGEEVSDEPQEGPTEIDADEEF